MKYFLGIDGGGTKTKFLITDDSGTIISESIQPTSHYLQAGFDGVTKVLNDGIDDCLSQANLNRNQISYCFAACAGYGDIIDDDPKIEQSAKNALQSIPFTIGNDNENALAGSLGGKPGINIIAGTGSIGMGINEHNESYRSGGWHHAFLGDEGSAYWIASNMLRLYTRQSDHRDKKTMLYSYLNEIMNWTNDSDMLRDCVVAMNYDRTQIAALAKHAYILAQKNDPAILSVYDQAAKELSDIIKAIYHTLHMEYAKVSYSGGVFSSGSYILEPLRKHLEDINIDLVEPVLPPDKGSVLLAMKYGNIEITDKLISKLKTA
ncbi:MULTISPECIES: BadF/BadG/BcrA/BcrD ATPase family protein [unclassified Breznakia]|uniref:N-acetylglucosamine kinase n=1 Tax=unclassified Breznakia TaxID=2623764 RepID=UPI002475A47E|nr:MULTISPECIES: BadF/BadG/BcrA/BcrD ATPase family protein [unclassified Breznakia]MDH6367249.1 N-acetylglucosamine kinase-like BadF-type ATPase [Breznakia sp. PH1-1]MDH6404428.1 N-acetylglucosamine kinase-like BadF-type ATPase [Breznakia sp. PF1-11]MDH6412181.1 N-acetylglucosamine kinase-like BadF-type ATPase [Breznakia sp. PFB1-11]MDH6414416.1 N-acetylglucosamine kinase-like BadF-type ATPase [Breznakia sp. PFB1-14]MDH6416801.1 N-acetylglucosamine kinase-like BadF-type ATPase [Breznakia sp. P